MTPAAKPVIAIALRRTRPFLPWSILLRATRARLGHGLTSSFTTLRKHRLPAYHPDTPEVRHDWAQYYDKVTEMDAQVGKLLKQLDEDGLRESTIVFYYGDHGSGMPRSKRHPFDSGLRVPMLLSVPEKVSAPRAPRVQSRSSIRATRGFRRSGTDGAKHRRNRNSRFDAGYGIRWTGDRLEEISIRLSRANG